jgi:hypothetical protein
MGHGEEGLDQGGVIVGRDFSHGQIGYRGVFLLATLGGTNFLGSNLGTFRSGTSIDPAKLDGSSLLQPAHTNAPAMTAPTSKDLRGRAKTWGRSIMNSSLSKNTIDTATNSLPELRITQARLS